MKKIILSIFALGTLAMNAQDGSFAKGNVALSGEVGNLTTKILDANVSPSMMYFVSDNIALRGGLTFGNSETTVAGVSTGESSNFGVNFGANYYFSKSRFTPFIGASVDFGSGSTKASATAPEAKTSNMGLNVFPGVNAFLTKRLAMNASFGSLGYTTTTATSTTNVETKTSGFGFDFNLNTVRLGVTWVLN
jgi:hypothetical protein